MEEKITSETFESNSLRITAICWVSNRYEEHFRAILQVMSFRSHQKLTQRGTCLLKLHFPPKWTSLNLRALFPLTDENQYCLLHCVNSLVPPTTLSHGCDSAPREDQELERIMDQGLADDFVLLAESLGFPGIDAALLWKQLQWNQLDPRSPPHSCRHRL